MELAKIVVRLRLDLWSIAKKRKKPAVPPHFRIYAIGDVHGREDLLRQVFDKIDDDLSKRPATKAFEILLGDYIDRGPHSRQVIDSLIIRQQQKRTVCLKGNHETYVESFLRDPDILDDWRHYGALETLMSYGITPQIASDLQEGDSNQDLANAFANALPRTHRQFLGSLRPSISCGDFFFAHAGVRPGVALDKQQEEDLLWIREDFLLSEDDFGKVVVHGHTPVREPDFRPNRINIDTGAYATGNLTCIILEGDQITAL